MDSLERFKRIESLVDKFSSEEETCYGYHNGPNQ